MLIEPITPIDSPTEGLTIMAQHTTSAVAEKLSTTPRELRKFLRTDASGIESVGKGSRYMIDGKDLQGLKKRFKAHQAAQAADKAAKATAPAETAEELAQAHLTDMGEDRDPTDEEIEAMADIHDLDA